MTDQYGGLNSQEFEDYCTSLGINHIFTAVDAAFSNGLNERCNQTLSNQIQCKYNENKRKIAWSTVAHKYTNEYNSTIHSVTGFLPKYLMFGIPEYVTLQTLLEAPDLLTDREIAFHNTLKNHNANNKKV